MKRPLSTLAFVLFALIAAQTASAQFMPKKIWTLTVVANVPGAVIYVDNQQVPGNQTKVTGGAHNVKVMADGYLAFNGPVMVNGDQTFNVTLQRAPMIEQIRPQPSASPCRSTSTFPRRGVHRRLPGPGRPPCGPGPHSVQVSANGYQDYSASVNVAAPSR